MCIHGRWCHSNGELRAIALPARFLGEQMTLFIACVLLYQFDWPWYWYPVAVVIWVLHEYQVHAYFNGVKRTIALKYR